MLASGRGLSSSDSGTLIERTLIPFRFLTLIPGFEIDPPGRLDMRKRKEREVVIDRAIVHEAQLDMRQTNTAQQIILYQARICIIKVPLSMYYVSVYFSK